MEDTQFEKWFSVDGLQSAENLQEIQALFPTFLSSDEGSPQSPPEMYDVKRIIWLLNFDSRPSNFLQFFPFELLNAKAF